MIKKITYSAIYFALIIVFTFTPYTGYITVGIVSITTIPSFIAIATWHIGSLGGFMTALGFGLGSYFKALTGVGWPLFAIAPELAIIPRILLWIVILIIIKCLKKIKYWKVIISCLATVIFNTILVTTTLFIIQIYRNNDYDFKQWILIIYINFLAEICVSIFIGSVMWNPLRELKINYERQIQNSW